MLKRNMIGQPPILLAIFALFFVACSPAVEPSAIGSGRPATLEPTFDPDSPLVRDAAAFAESEGIPLAEALRRLEFQDTIGDIQPALEADLRDTYAGLWVQHQPDYRIVIALTEGDRSTVEPYITGKPWADYVEVRPVAHTLRELRQAQEEATQAASSINATFAIGVDVMNNRVELTVGNPDIFLADLEASGLSLPEVVEVLPIQPGAPLPDTNQGVLFEAQTADGRTIYLPKQPPSPASMAALMEGTLVETNGCLRVTDGDYENGFLVLWPHDSDIRVTVESIDVLNGEMQVVARVGQPIRLGGGAIESTPAMENLDALIPGLPLDACSGPYWVAAPLETLAEQSIPDIYVNPITSGGQMLAIVINQSRPSQAAGELSGELTVDEEGCLQVSGHTILWPPNVYLRENPLRLVSDGETPVAVIGDTITIPGALKGPDDYRYFDNKMTCPGPYWGAAELSVAE